MPSYDVRVSWNVQPLSPEYLLLPTQQRRAVNRELLTLLAAAIPNHATKWERIPVLSDDLQTVFETVRDQLYNEVPVPANSRLVLTQPTAAYKWVITPTGHVIIPTVQLVNTNDSSLRDWMMTATGQQPNITAKLGTVFDCTLV